MKGLSIYIRPLQIEDAEVSYKWRNNPRIWRFTGSRPNREITPEIEKEWLEKVLQSKNEKRFAICCKNSNTYIGNVFLTDINHRSAIIHIFIGEIENWGRRRALEAMALLLDYAFAELNLDNVYALIDKQNTSSVALAKNFQCIPVETYTHSETKRLMMKWQFSKDMFKSKIHIQVLKDKPTIKGI